MKQAVVFAMSLVALLWAPAVSAEAYSRALERTDLTEEERYIEKVYLGFNAAIRKAFPNSPGVSKPLLVEAGHYILVKRGTLPSDNARCNLILSVDSYRKGFLTIRTLPECEAALEVVMRNDQFFYKLSNKKDAFHYERYLAASSLTNPLDNNDSVSLFIDDLRPRTFEFAARGTSTAGESVTFPRTAPEKDGVLMRVLIGGLPQDLGGEFDAYAAEAINVNPQRIYAETQDAVDAAWDKYFKKVQGYWLEHSHFFPFSYRKFDAELRQAGVMPEDYSYMHEPSKSRPY